MNPVNPQPVEVLLVICGVLLFTGAVMFLAQLVEIMWDRYQLWRSKKWWEKH